MKVRPGSTYMFLPCLLDRIDPPPSYCRTPSAGQIVRVVNLPGAPKANVMKHAYIESLAGEIFHLVSTSSLHKIPAHYKYSDATGIPLAETFTPNELVCNGGCTCS